MPQRNSHVALPVVFPTWPSCRCYSDNRRDPVALTIGPAVRLSFVLLPLMRVAGQFGPITSPSADLVPSRFSRCAGPATRLAGSLTYNTSVNSLESACTSWWFSDYRIPQGGITCNHPIVDTAINR